MFKSGLKCELCESEELELNWTYISEYNLFLECKGCGRMYRLGQSNNEMVTVNDFVRDNNTTKG